MLLLFQKDSFVQKVQMLYLTKTTLFYIVVYGMHFNLIKVINKNNTYFYIGFYLSKLYF